MISSTSLSTLGINRLLISHSNEYMEVVSNCNFNLHLPDHPFIRLLAFIYIFLPAYLVHLFFKFLLSTIHIIREGSGTPLQYSCLENPMDGGAW